jgi:hypothetical protein
VSAPSKAIVIQGMQEEVDRLQKRLDDEIERNHELTALLEESGYRRRHQIEDDGGNATDEIVRVDSGHLALSVNVESKEARGLKVAVKSYENSRIVIYSWGWRSHVVLVEAERRAKALLTHDHGFLRPELTRADVTKILLDQLRWARGCKNP